MVLLNSAVTLVVGSLATGATVLGVTTSAATDGDEPTLPCGAVFERLPDTLQDDLGALEAMTPVERRAALVSIRRDALHGTYGDRVQRFAEHRDERRKAVLDRLPAALRQDLRQARRLPVDERAAAYAEIRDRALAGDYGERVQQAAERHQARRAACAD